MFTSPLTPSMPPWAMLASTVRLIEGVEPENTHSIEELASDLNSRARRGVWLFSAAIRSIRLRLRSIFNRQFAKRGWWSGLGSHFDETSKWSHWHVPEAHYLETWSDSRAFDGTVTIQQPLVEPLYGGKSAHEIVSILQAKPDLSSHDIVKNYWQTPAEGRFRRNLEDIASTTASSQGHGVNTINAAAVPTLPALGNLAAYEMEVVIRPDSTIGDGTYSNNGWLQELPKSQSKMTWENPVTVSPGRAAKMSISTGDVLRVTVNGKSVEGPAWILPGQAENTIGVTLGYGREGSGRVGNNIGYNAYFLQDANTRYAVGGTVAKTGKHVDVADVQETQTMAEREPVRTTSLSEYKKHPDFPNLEEKPLDPEDNIYHRENWPYEGYKWGMVIDLNVCIGCHTCTIACQAENNIAVVGKEQVAKRRVMHWIRVDRYYSGDLDQPEIFNQPVPCMHCEQAPCEVVCPVAATVHSNEGLNEMVYNRCVGTRYCSNNCPYKVRRFNFLLYSDWQTESLHGVRNPDVTVRSRGVMEKCSYCVQRIQEAKIQTEKEGRRIKDGEVITACAAGLPDPGNRLWRSERQEAAKSVNSRAFHETIRCWTI